MNLTLQTGAMHIPVTVDGVQKGELLLNPDDTQFLSRFYALLPKLTDAQKNLSSEINAANGDAEKLIKAMNKMWEKVKSEIDVVFGSGTSEMVFGEICSIELCEQFFNGVANAIEKHRKPKLAKYKSVK